jgi:hypothetical protein
MAEQRAIFFLRHSNDIDHIAPIIHKWAKLEVAPASVVVWSGPELVEDYRLRFVKQSGDVSVRWIGEYLSAAQRVRWREMHRIWGQRASGLSGKVARGVARVLSLRPMIDLDLAERLLQTELAGADRGFVGFDWIVSSNLRRLIAPIVQASRRMGLPTVSLPHGDSPYANRMFYLEHLNYGFWRDFNDPQFDHVVVPNELTAGRYLPFRPSEQVHILGSPRFNAEWVPVLHSITPEFTEPASDGCLKVVMFLRNAVFPVFWDELPRVVSLITSFSDVFLVIRHHPRVGGAWPRRASRALARTGERLSKGRLVADDVPSSALVRWADLVLDMGSSIVSEAIALGKPILAMENLHANVSTAARFMPGSAIRCRDDLYDALKESLSDHAARRYSGAERDEYIRSVLDQGEADVLGRHVRFLAGLS